MKQKQMLLVAIACGVICALCVGLFMVSVRNEADAARNEALARFGGEQVEAFVATRDIVAGERVDLAAVETKLWVADLLPERAVRASSEVVGKTATSSIYKGEVITSGRFESGTDAIDVPAGKQAVSVPARAVQAVGGAIRAGMIVDIYSFGASSTTTLATGVSVLDTSVGSSSSFSASSDGWITLALDPGKVEEIIAASNKTTLYFSLPGASVDEVEAAAEADGAEGEASEAGADEGKAAEGGKKKGGGSAAEAAPSSSAGASDLRARVTSASSAPGQDDSSEEDEAESSEDDDDEGDDEEDDEGDDEEDLFEDDDLEYSEDYLSYGDYDDE